MKLDKSMLMLSICTAMLLGTGCGGGTPDTDNPVFNQASLNVGVQEATTDVLKVHADDKSSVTYSIVGGADASKFTINEKSGALSLIHALKFDTDRSVDGDRIYEVKVKATDKANNFAVQTILVKLTSTDTQAPTITSASTIDTAKSAEVVTKIIAQDQSLPITYSINGGDDQNLFDINSSSGELKFKTSPNYNPGGDNSYHVIIGATDAGENTQTQELTINVHDPKVVLSTGIPGEAGVARSWQKNKVDGEQSIITLEGNTLQWEDSEGNLPHRTFNGAKNYCDGLVYGGYDDWRLPTPNELHQLVNHALVGDPDKYIDSQFNYLELTYYWTNINLGNNTARAVNFVLGSDDEIDTTDSDGKNVRCVRGYLADGEFKATNDNNLVEDLSTSLIWDNSLDIGDDNHKYNHQGAINACEAKGMRLPTINELITLADYEQKKIRIPNPRGADTLYFWSSTPALYENNKYRYFSFDKAAGEFGSKTLDAPHEIYVRCVKSK